MAVSQFALFSTQAARVHLHHLFQIAGAASRLLPVGAAEHSRQEPMAAAAVVPGKPRRFGCELLARQLIQSEPVALVPLWLVLALRVVRRGSVASLPPQGILGQAAAQGAQGEGMPLHPFMLHRHPKGPQVEMAVVEELEPTPARQVAGLLKGVSVRHWAASPEPMAAAVVVPTRFTGLAATEGQAGARLLRAPTLRDSEAEAEAEAEAPQPQPGGMAQAA